jgi:hypothetical protein
LNNFAHGHGVQTFTEDSKELTYDGQWEEDNRAGNGTLIWKDGTKYDGEWFNDFFHGHGVLNFAEDSAGLNYDGEWKEGKQSGNGTYIWKNGQKYVGEFKDDLRNGEGILYSATNEIISQGQWEKDSFIGK